MQFHSRCERQVPRDFYHAGDCPGTYRLNLDVVSISGGNSLSLGWLEALISRAHPESRENPNDLLARAIHMREKTRARLHVRILSLSLSFLRSVCVCAFDLNTGGPIRGVNS